jgi:hypothetical protein
VSELGEPTPDRGSPAPTVAGLGSPWASAASVGNGDGDFGTPLPDRGSPPPSAVQLGMARPAGMALAEDPLGSPTPDRGGPPPLAVAMSDAGGSPTSEQLFGVVREVSVVRAGDDGYGAALVDPPSHAGDGDGEGLRAGLLLFGLASGDLGGVLSLMHQRDPVVFSETFGPSARELLAVATASSRAERLVPVGGVVLWNPAWIARFAAAGTTPTYRFAQNEYAVERVVRPLIPTAERFGLHGLGEVAVLVERIVALGRDTALSWLERVLGGSESTEQPIARLRHAVGGIDRSTMDRLLTMLSGPHEGPGPGPLPT